MPLKEVSDPCKFERSVEAHGVLLLGTCRQLSDHPSLPSIEEVGVYSYYVLFLNLLSGILYFLEPPHSSLKTLVLVTHLCPKIRFLLHATPLP